MALAHPIDGVVIDHHRNIHIDIQPVGTRFQFFADFLPLPAIPIGDVGKLGIFCRQSAQLCQSVLRTAIAADQLGALAPGGAFRHAVGAFIEDPVQAVCPVRLIDHHSVFLLPPEIIEAKGLVQLGIQFRHGHGLQIFFGKEALHIGTNLHLPLFQLVIKGLAGKGTLGNHRYHRNAQLLQQNAHFSGQCRCGAVKGIAGLRIHQHTDLLLLQHILHIPHKAKIADKFLGGDAADQRHQPAHQRAYKAVGSGDNAIGPGEEHPGGDLHIHKARMVHQNQAGFFLADFLHASCLIGKLVGQ